AQNVCAKVADEVSRAPACRTDDRQLEMARYAVEPALQHAQQRVQAIHRNERVAQQIERGELRQQLIEVGCLDDLHGTAVAIEQLLQIGNFELQIPERCSVERQW